MAKKKAPKEKAEKSDSETLLHKIRDRAKAMFEHDRGNRQAALDDLRFLHIPGEQWTLDQRRERGDRPCYEFNKLKVTTKRIVNDMRANRPQGKVRAVEDNDKDTADVMEGLIRNIWNISDADTVIDYAAEYQVGGGMGAWRVATEYSEDSFTQDIKIEAIRNPFCLYADPACADPLKRDAEDWVLTDLVSESAYKARWPKDEIVSFDRSEFDDNGEWWDADTKMVRICEYWWKEPYDKEIWQLSDGKVIDKTEGVDPATITQKRTVHCNKIMMCISSGDAILEGPTEWAGKEFPFVQIYGEWIIIEGKIYWSGLTRTAKDPQRSYNMARTAIAETIAAAPQAKFWATPEQAQGHTGEWAEAHKKLFPFQLYNADPKAPGPPQRMGGADVPAALIEESQIASEEIKAVTGIYDASLGNQSNETSGIAIRSRQAQGEVATFNFSDNQAKGIKRTWELLIDLTQKVFDTERVVRTLGVDGAEKYVKINTFVQDPTTGQMKRLNDLGSGKFDVTVTVGPSFATQRQEASEMFTEIAKAWPPFMQLAGDYFFKAQDMPYSDKIAERMKFALLPEIQKQEQQDKPMPPEVQAAMAQADQAMQQVQQQGQLVQQAAQEAQTEKADADKAKSEVQIAIANLKVQEANLAADVAQFKQLVAEQQLKMGTEQDQQAVVNDREFLATQLQQSLSDIQQQTAQFMTQAAGVIAEMQARGQPNIVVPHKPRMIRMEAKRVNGSLVATPVYEDQQPTVQPMQPMSAPA